MSLKITDVKIETLLTMFEWTFVRVYCGDLYGNGEAGPSPGLKASEFLLRKLLVGEDAMKINRIEEKLRHASLYAGTSFYHLISAVNIALHDLVAKSVNLPLWRFLGGDREEVRVYVDAHAGSGLEATNSLLMPVRFEKGREGSNVRTLPIVGGHPVEGRLAMEKWDEAHSPEAYAKRTVQMKKAGYTAMKFDLDIPTPYTKKTNIRSGEVTLKEADYMGEIAEAVRRAAGEEVELMVDLHWRYNINSALRICKALEPYKLRWVEDVTPAVRSVSNLDELKLVTSRTSVPIATGENLYTSYQFKDLIDTGVAVWTPDLAKAGGITEGRRIAELAAMYDIEFSPHNISSPIGTMATAHAASCANTFGALEFHSHDLPLWKEMYIPKRPLIENGFIRLTEDPGLGIDLDESAIRRHFPEYEL